METDKTDKTTVLPSQIVIEPGPDSESALLDGGNLSNIEKWLATAVAVVVILILLAGVGLLATEYLGGGWFGMDETEQPGAKVDVPHSNTTSETPNLTSTVNPPASPTDTATTTPTSTPTPIPTPTETATETPMATPTPTPTATNTTIRTPTDTPPS